VKSGCRCPPNRRSEWAADRPAGAHDLHEACSKGGGVAAGMHAPWVAQGADASACRGRRLCQADCRDLGAQSLHEIERYTAAADQKRLSRGAIAKLKPGNGV
jgi:hypothetical protein